MGLQQWTVLFSFRRSRNEAMAARSSKQRRNYWNKPIFAASLARKRDLLALGAFSADASLASRKNGF